MGRSRLPDIITRRLVAEVPDADLLDRYLRRRDDHAFAQLVSRYHRLVWGLCRNLLPDDADADDAFQATFLTLARSAKSVRSGAPLGPWLHGVAYRVCMNARRAQARRVRHEKAAGRPEASRPIADSAWEGAFAAAAEEVQKLPDAERMAFVLCYLEGRTAAVAAVALGVTPGAFAARLTRAKQKLLDRLSRRGLGVAALAFGGVAGAVADAPAALVVRTLALVPSDATVPREVHTLMQGVTGMMTIRFKLLAVGVLVATALGLGVGGWYGTATADEPGGAGDPAPKAAAPAREELTAATPEDIRRAYFNNDAAGDDRYLGKRIRLTSPWWSVVGAPAGPGGPGGYLLVMEFYPEGAKGGDPASGQLPDAMATVIFAFRFPTASRAALTALKFGQPVTVEGVCAGRTGAGGRVTFTDCKIVDQPKP